MAIALQPDGTHRARGKSGGRIVGEEDEDPPQRAPPAWLTTLA